MLRRFILSCAGFAGLFAAGCGGGSSSTPDPQPAGGQAAAPANPAAAVPGMSAIPGAGHGGMHGMQAMHGAGATPGATPTSGANAAAPAAAASSGKAKLFSDLKQFLPPLVTRVVGMRAADLKAGKSELGDSLLRTLSPVLNVATRLGVPDEDVDLVLAGGNPKSHSVLLFFRSKKPLKSADIIKTSGAEAKGEKINKATLHTLPKHGETENAIAFLDADVLMVGRKDMLTEALKNPGDGPARSGIEAISVDSTLFFVAGDNLGKQTFDSQNGLRGLAALVDSKTSQVKGIGLGLTGGGTASAGGTGAGAATTDMASMHGAATPPAGMHAAPGSGTSAAAAMHATAGGTTPAGMHAHAAPGGQPASTSAPAAAITLNKDLTGRVTVVVGVSFASETAAKVAEDKVNAAWKRIRDIEKLLNSLSNQTGTGAGGAGTGGMHAGPGGMHTPPAGPNSSSAQPMLPESGPRSGTSPRDKAIFSREVLAAIGLIETPDSSEVAVANERERSRFDPLAVAFNIPPELVSGAFDRSYAQAAGQPTGHTPPTGHAAPGSTTDPAGMGGATAPGGTGGTANRRLALDPWLTFELGFGVSRAKDKIQLTSAVESRVFGDNLVRLADILGAAGATAVDDGVYAGTLSTLNEPIKSWLGDASKAENHKGARRVGDLPLRAGYSWMSELLPYVGREDLYLKLDFTKSWREGENYPLTHQVIPQFLNPSDPRVQLRGLPYDGMGATHFVGMSGVEDGRNIVAAGLPRSDPRAGVFGYDAIAKPEEITDGQANTILLIGSGKVIGGWVIGGGATIRGARTPYFDPITGFGSEGLGSPGAYVLMADGSTRVINGSIDEKVFRAMCTIHGSDSADQGTKQARSD